VRERSRSRRKRTYQLLSLENHSEGDEDTHCEMFPIGLKRNGTERNGMVGEVE
jgi:hypothetical protein